MLKDSTPELQPAAAGSAALRPERRAAGVGRDLTRRLLHGNAVTTAWRLNYIANLYAVPFYLALEQRIGISRPEYVILFCAAHHPGVTAQEIVIATGRPKNSISVAIAKLERKHLISRRPNKSDSRRMEVRITPAGRAVYRRVVPLLKDRERRMIAALSVPERRRLDALLMKIAMKVPDWGVPDFAALPRRLSTGKPSGWAAG